MAEAPQTTQPTEYLSVAEAARRVPGNNRPHAVWRWARKGLKARSGEIVKLRHVRVGGRLMIPADALEEFHQALAAADAPHFDKPADTPRPPQAPSPRTVAERNQAVEESEQKLAQWGV